MIVSGGDREEVQFVVSCSTRRMNSVCYPLLAGELPKSW